MKLKLLLLSGLLYLGNLSYSQVTTCTYGSVNFTQSGSGAVKTLTAVTSGYSSPSYKWTYGTTVLGTSSTQSYTYSSTASNYVCLQITNITSYYDSSTGRLAYDTCQKLFCDTVTHSSTGPCTSFVVDAGPDTICTNSGIYTATLGGSPSASGGTPNYVYVWSFNSINSSLSSTGVSNPVATVWARYSTFILTVYDTLGCVKSDTVVIDTNCSRTISLKENNTINSLKLYPNPANNNITISYNSTVSTNGNIQVTDLIGKVVLNKEIEFNVNSKSEEKINISNLSKGSYLVRIRDNKNGSYISKPIRFVKQ